MDVRLGLRGSGIHVVLIEPGLITTRFRANSIAPFERHVDWRTSPHRARYEEELLARLYATDPLPDRFELPAKAVTAALVRALESPRPAPRYRVTVPARWASLMRRLLSTRLLDALLHRR